MPDTQDGRHPFMDDLTADVKASGTALDVAAALSAIDVLQKAPLSGSTSLPSYLSTLKTYLSASTVNLSRFCVS